MNIMKLLDRGAGALVSRVMSYTEARHKVIAGNIANIDTPGYRTRQLDPAIFQQELKKAVSRRPRESAPLELERTREFRVDSTDRLVVEPTVEPPENLLFHDRSNARIERQMATLAENAVAHQLATELFRGRVEGLMKAIRGRT